MMRGGYDADTGVMTIDEVIDLDTLNLDSDTIGRYKPHGVYFRGDRVPIELQSDDDDYIIQHLRRQPFQFGGVRLGPGTDQPCRADQEEVNNPYNNRRYCVKPCRVGYTRNYSTNRCYRQDAVRRRRFECRPGYARNADTGRCKKFAKAPEGQWFVDGDGNMFQMEQRDGEWFRHYAQGPGEILPEVYPLPEEGYLPEVQLEDIGDELLGIDQPEEEYLPEGQLEEPEEVALNTQELDDEELEAILEEYEGGEQPERHDLPDVVREELDAINADLLGLDGEDVMNDLLE